MVNPFFSVAKHLLKRGSFPDSDFSQQSEQRLVDAVRCVSFDSLSGPELSRKRCPIKSCTARVQAHLIGHASHLVGAPRLYLVRAL